MECRDGGKRGNSGVTTVQAVMSFACRSRCVDRTGAFYLKELQSLFYVLMTSLWIRVLQQSETNFASSEKPDSYGGTVQFNFAFLPDEVTRCTLRGKRWCRTQRCPSCLPDTPAPPVFLIRLQAKHLLRMSQKRKVRHHGVQTPICTTAHRLPERHVKRRTR